MQSLKQYESLTCWNFYLKIIFMRIININDHLKAAVSPTSTPTEIEVVKINESVKRRLRCLTMEFSWILHKTWSIFVACPTSCSSSSMIHVKTRDCCCTFQTPTFLPGRLRARQRHCRTSTSFWKSLMICSTLVWELLRSDRDKFAGDFCFAPSSKLELI